MKNLPQRKSIRLKNYDYSAKGFYFITICTQNRECLFGDIIDGKMALNEEGKIIKNIWGSLPDHHPVKLNMFQIMPNHVHLVIQTVGATRGSPVIGGPRPQTGGPRPQTGGPRPQTGGPRPQTGGPRPQTGGPRPQTGGPRPQTGGPRPAPTKLGTIVGLFKSECTKQIRRSLGQSNMIIWQRNYHEHIIRTENDLNKIRQYIIINPTLWYRDRNNPKNYKINL